MINDRPPDPAEYRRYDSNGDRFTFGLPGMFDLLLQVKGVQIVVGILLILASFYLFSIGSVVVPLVFLAVGVGILLHHWRNFRKTRGV